MPLVHVGIEPEFKTVAYNDKLKAVPGFRFELLPDGGYRKWSDRMLKSGCYHKFGLNDSCQLGDLIYCPKCDEYFSENQFKQLSEVEDAECNDIKIKS